MQQYQLIARWLRGEIPNKLMPWQIDLDTTNICNQDCYYCNTDQFRKDKPIYQKTSAYLELIDKFYNWRKYDSNIIGTLSNVIFSGGGEPTLLPGYEQIIEKTIDSGFVAAMNTNGTKLDKLLNMHPDKIKKMAYIGIDIDSGIPETYESIRRSRMSESPFDKVKDIAKELGKFNAPIDIKALLMPENTSEVEIDALFKYAKEVNARGMHLRPIVLNDESFVLTEEIKQRITNASIKYDVPANLALGRYQTREYKQCHQMFLFPSFCADGSIYLCCEYKGREDLKLGSWIDDDWRDLWCGDRHREIYNNFKTVFCKPCRPNTTNNLIEHSLVDYSSILKGFI